MRKAGVSERGDRCAKEGWERGGRGEEGRRRNRPGGCKET